MMVCESGGCGWTGPDLEDFSLQLLKQEVTSRLSTTSDMVGETDSAFIDLFNRLFTKRQALNKRYTEFEKNREPVTSTIYEITYDPKTQSERLWNPEAETYLGDMLENTRKFAEKENKPELYNAEETAALLFLEQCIIKGDVSYGIVPAYEPVKTVRYVTEMKRNGNTVEAKYTDIGLSAGDLTAEQAVSFIKRLEDAQPNGRVVEHGMNYPLLMLRNTRETRTRAMSMETVFSVRANEEAPVPLNSIDVDIIGDTIQTTARAGILISKDTVSALHSLGTLRVAEMLHRKKNTHNVISVPRESSVQSPIVKNAEITAAPEIQYNSTLHINVMSLKIDSILKPVRTIRHGDVGMEVSHIENMPKNEDSNHTETIKHFDTEKISETEYASELPILPVVKKEAKKAKKTEKKRIMKKELVKKKEKVKKKEHITKKEQTRRIRLMESIARIIKTLSRQTEISSRPSFSKAVEAFALAYAIRMKLQLPEQVSLHEKRKIPEKGTCTKQKNEITDGHASSWLLFAIIRYLVMIREQGAVSASGAKYQAKTKKKSVNSSQIVITIPMQQHAVIFAFVPAPESQNDSVRDFADNNHAVEAHFVI